MSGSTSLCPLYALDRKETLPLPVSLKARTSMCLNINVFCALLTKTVPHGCRNMKSFSSTKLCCFVLVGLVMTMCVYRT